MNRLFATAGIGMLSLMLGVPAVVNAQDEKPARQEEPKAEPKSEPRQQEPKPQKQEEVKPKHDEHQRPEDAREQGHPEQGRQEDHAARPAGRSAHIPDDKFREHFGRQHTVVIRQPVIVEGQPRFQSGGYWFVISDPWPVGWAYTDECYVDYIDGDYFLFDLLHPGVRVALFVVM